MEWWSGGVVEGWRNWSGGVSVWMTDFQKRCEEIGVFWKTLRRVCP